MQPIVMWFRTYRSVGFGFRAWEKSAVFSFLWKFRVQSFGVLGFTVHGVQVKVQGVFRSLIWTKWKMRCN